MFDSRDPRCKTPFGAVPTDEIVTFRVFLPISSQLDAPCLLMFKADQWDCPERVPMVFSGSDGVVNTYRCDFKSSNPQLYFYRFEVSGINGQADLPYMGMTCGSSPSTTGTSKPPIS